MCLVRALTALNRNGHTGTGHEQRHDGEEGRARCAGERQLRDVLHVLDLDCLVGHALVKPACQTEVVGADQLEGRLAGFLVHS